MGGGQIVYVFPFPGEKGKHINKIPRKSQEKAGTVPGYNPVKILFMRFLVYWFCFTALLRVGKIIIVD